MKPGGDGGRVPAPVGFGAAVVAGSEEWLEGRRGKEGTAKS